LLPREPIKVCAVELAEVVVAQIHDGRLGRLKASR
jgi:hypothetical protein